MTHDEQIDQIPSSTAGWTKLGFKTFRSPHSSFHNKFISELSTLLSCSFLIPSCEQISSSWHWDLYPFLIWNCQLIEILNTNIVLSILQLPFCCNLNSFLSLAARRGHYTILLLTFNLQPFAYNSLQLIQFILLLLLQVLIISNEFYKTLHLSSHYLITLW